MPFSLFQSTMGSGGWQLNFGQDANERTPGRACDCASNNERDSIHLIGATTIFSLQSRPPHSLSTSHEPLLSARAGVFEELERGERLIAD